MKKRLIIGIISIFIIGAIGFISCGDEVKDAITCADLSAKMVKAMNAYNDNPTSVTCNDYKDAIQDYIDDCDDLTQTQIEDLEITLDDLDCSVLD